MNKSLRSYLTLILLLLACQVSFGQRFWVAAGASNWNNTANWSTTSGGPGGASVPGPSDAVTFNASGLGDCTLDVAPNVAGITVNGYTGTIDINGFNLTTTGTNSFVSGTINNGGAAAAVTLNTTGTTTFSGTTFGAAINGSTGRIFFNGSTFNGNVSISKTDNNSDNSSGNNVFNGTTTITNLGGGHVLLGNSNRDQFNGPATFNNNGSYRFYFAYNHGGQTTTFADLTLNTNKSGGTDAWSFFANEGNNTSFSVSGTLTINCNGTLQSNHRFLQGTGTSATYGAVSINLTNSNTATTLQMGVNGTSTYNGNITLSNTGGGLLNFNVNASASSTLVAGRTISAGSFPAGRLVLERFGAIDNQTILLTGTARLDVGPGTSFAGNVDFRAPQMYLNGIIVGGTSILEKTGGVENNSTGGNTFTGLATVINSGTESFNFANTNPDIFNGGLTINNTGTSRVQIGINSAGNQINGDLIINHGGSASGGINTIIARNTGSSATINGNVTLTCTNTNAASGIIIGREGDVTINGNISVTSTSGSGIYFGYTTGTVNLGAGFSITQGTFDTGTLQFINFTQAGSTAQNLTLTGTATLISGPGSAFGGNVNFTSPRLQLNGTTYSGTVTLQKTGAGNDNSSGGNIFTGVTDITNSGSGYLLLGNGTSDQFLSSTTFNNTGSYRIYFAYNHGGQTTTFGSDLTLNSNKSGGSDEWSYLIGHAGTNTALSVAGTLTINCAGSIESDHMFLNGTGSSAVFSGPVNINLTNTSTGTSIRMGENGTSTYNNNITVTNSGGAAGITFNAGATASSTLNGVITAGTFSSGSLNLYRFTQVGALVENLTLTGTSLLRVGPSSSFDGLVTFVSPRLFLNGATYNNTTILEKSGPSNDDGAGGNIFNGTTTLTASSSGYLLTANTSPDIFNGPLTVTNSGSNYIFLAHNVAGNQFNNDIFLNNTGSALGILFSNNATGSSTFTNGFLQVGGSGFSTGDLRLRRFSQVGAFNQTLALAGSARLWIGPDSSFDGDVTFTSPQLLLNGATYNGITTLEKSGASPSGPNDGTGGNVFNQLTTLVNSGSAYLLTGASNPDIFNNDLIITNSGSSTIRLADNSAGNQFNGNIELNSTFGGGIYFGNNAFGTSTLAAGKTIGVGTSGVISGDIRLIRFSQDGPTPQALDLTGIAILTLGPASEFDGDVIFRAPQLLLNGTVFNGDAELEKKGATNNGSAGGNTFNGITTIINSGAGYLLTGNTSADIFNDALTVTNTGSSVIFLAHNSAGNQFNGNITFNSTLGSGGIYFSNAAGGTSTLNNSASLNVGGLGFSSGLLSLIRFTQSNPPAPLLSLVLTGTALMRIGPSSTFNGDVDFRAPQFQLNGATYNGTTYLEKTGATNNDSSGDNIFNGSTTIANSGAGYFRFAVTALDTFNGDLTLTNTGSSTIRMADNVPGTVFNGNITVNSTFGGGIYFSESGGGTATLAAGKTISVGGSGFSLGDLRIRRFTQTGATPQTLLLTGTASLYLGPSISFDGDVDFRSPQLFINGGVFNGTSFLEKTGATSNLGNGNTTFNGTTTIQNSGTGFLRTNGGNTFNGVTSLINSGSNDLLLELVSASVYNNSVTMTNTGTSNIRPAYIGSNTFNGNIEVNSTSGTGIYFSENAAGSATLASGRTITVGGTGFTAGELRLQRFTQFGTTAQNLVLTGSSTFRTGPSSTWNGNLTVSSPSVFLDGATFNGSNSFTKTGASTDGSIGGNIFVGASTFTNAGTGIFRLGNTSVDEFIGSTTFIQTSGTIQPAYNSASNFYNDVNVDGAASITFGANNGTIVLAGGAAQNINKLGTASPVFRRLTMNKSGGSATLNTDASITINGTFTDGVLFTSATNYLNFADNATVTGGSNSSHIDGPVRKTGNDAFSFPTGDGGFYRPISITAPTNTTHYFTAEYFKASQAFGGPSTYPTGIITVSSCEYWMLDRSPGGSNVSVTLSWNTPDCTGPYITNIATLRVVRWDGTAWVNHGNGGTTGNATAGTIISAGAITSFSPITLGSSDLANPLPVELIHFAATAENESVKLNWTTASELNNDFFTVQHSTNGVEFTSLGIINGQGTTHNSTSYEFIDETPHAGINYYRLKQTDFDGTSDFSNVVAVNMNLEWMLYPNPVTYGTDVTINKKDDYAVYNNLGVMVMKLSDTTKINIATLAPGVYTVRGSNGSVRRLVVK